MTANRRILVIFEPEGDKQQKLVLSIDPGATIESLANEIANRVGEPAVILEVGDGFALYPKDAVNVILDSDIVIARLHPVSTAHVDEAETTGRNTHETFDKAESSTAKPTNPSPAVPTAHMGEHATAHAGSSSVADITQGSMTESLTPPPPYGNLPFDDERMSIKEEGLGRFQLRFVTAELARQSAKSTLVMGDSVSEPANSVLAFDGEFINGNTTFATLKREAAQRFDWICDDDASDEGLCNHATSSFCSCAIAQEVVQHGLFSTLHCRFAVDGTTCDNDHCPYSHTPLADGGFCTTTSRCSVCYNALASPCPSCLATGQGNDEPVIYCSIISNAGCNHMHHAHCVGPRKDSSPLGCPSGCPRYSVLREAVPFGQSIPSLVVVWDGSRIDMVPVPSAYLEANSTVFRLETDDVQNIVGGFLESKSVRLEDLSVRIHSRDPVTETVSFTWSTLVSVCSMSLHQTADHRRFTFRAAGASTSRDSSNKPMTSPCVDFHTSKQPLLVCSCTRLKDVFPDSHAETPITLYVVKREASAGFTSHPKHTAIPISKQSAYLLDPSWQPLVLQTNRGMASLLSSLFVLSHMVSKRGIIEENQVLAALYAVSRFPPAVRTLGLLFLNITPSPQERAAFSSALFCSLEGFFSAAPHAIRSNPSRRFEMARIFLGYLLNTTVLSSVAVRPLKPVSLTCPLSQNRLSDPVLLDSIVVKRDAALHLVSGGLLYRPEHGKEAKTITELGQDHDLLHVLPQSAEHNGPEIYTLRLPDIPSIDCAKSLEDAVCDFSTTIRRTNESDLVTRGPLELKSTSVVPPQIVLDAEGYLAVFTGRGCGTIRDVNFFQPTSGGDTEVDVNDVEHTLQRIIKAREAEDTWEIDCFGGILAKARTPNEAIVFCLDLSQSMNNRSAVGGSKSTASKSSDHMTGITQAVAEVLDGCTLVDISLNARKFIREQHESCHTAWVSLVENGTSTRELVRHLGVIAAREVLRIHWSSPSLCDKDWLLALASFASICRTQPGVMTEDLSDFLAGFKPSVTLGTPPYDVPRHLVDGITGDLLPPLPFRWSILGPSKGEPHRISRAAWLSCKDILDSLSMSNVDEVVTVTLRHEEKTFPWRLPVSAPIRTLYRLANRVTQAKYSSFVVRMSTTKLAIADSSIMPIRTTYLRGGGPIELSMLQVHSRKLETITVEFPDSEEIQTISLPSDAPALALLSRVRTTRGEILSDIQLWRGLYHAGDGHQFGTRIHPADLRINGRSFECRRWSWIPPDRQKVTQESKSLTRLELLKELFNIFLNRVSSFDTSVSLVLGLVTFSDMAQIKQELTPIFEEFRQELEEVKASGDTAMYDALDMARKCLVNFRKDLPKLRRRIIIVSDGEDTSSISQAEDVGAAVNEDDIIVDSVQVGNFQSQVLHRFSAATGGYRFFPKSTLADALSIFDLETMMYSAERPVRPRMHCRTTIWGMNQLYPIDVVTIDQFPQRAQHPKLQESVRDVKKSIGDMVLSNDRTRRVMRELKALKSDPHPQIDVYVNDQDMSFFKVVIEAPNDIEQCPYKGGCFLLTCDLPAEYPRNPPEIRFVTFILHPNVSKQGKVCVAELSRLWSSDITLKELFSLIYGLLLEPDLDNPLEIQASLKYYDDDGTFALAAANAVKNHANKSRSDWRKELEK